jgi:hypothetical protein
MTKVMERLNLPDCKLKLRFQNSRQEIFDDFRKRFVSLTPEEWVRQHFAHYLVSERNFPKGLMALEYSLNLNGLKKRIDILAFSPEGKAILAVECKASHVKIDQSTFDQIARYNMVLKIDYLIVTNGLNHYVCKLDYDNLSFKYLPNVPTFDELF